MLFGRVGVLILGILVDEWILVRRGVGGSVVKFLDSYITDQSIFCFFYKLNSNT